MWLWEGVVVMALDPASTEVSEESCSSGLRTELTNSSSLNMLEKMGCRSSSRNVSGNLFGNVIQNM